MKELPWLQVFRLLALQGKKFSRECVGCFMDLGIEKDRFVKVQGKNDLGSGKF